jgi:hypothetical protein
MIIKITSPDIIELNQIRTSLNTEVISERISEVEVFEYSSKTDLETFIRRLVYLPLYQSSDIREFNLNFESNEPFTGLLFNSLISGYKTIEDINILNEGSFKIRIKIEEGKGKIHSRYDVVEEFSFNEENKTLFVNLLLDENLFESKLGGLIKSFPNSNFNLIDEFTR